MSNDDGERTAMAAPDIIDPGTAIEAKMRGMTNQLIETAKAHPRDLAAARTSLMALATEDEEVAASCYYSIPRAGKLIEGPSARLAEMVSYCWGNIQVTGRIAAIDATHVHAEAQCVDLERVSSATVETSRKITDKNGKRFTEDMVTVTGNAAISIAMRNAIFKVVPFSLVKKIYEQARTVAAGDAGTLQQRRQQMLAWFAKLGVVEDQILAKLEVSGASDIGLSHMKTLVGIATGLREGQSQVEDIFPPETKEGTTGFGKKKGEHTPPPATTTAAEKPPAPEPAKKSPPPAQKPDAPYVTAEAKIRLVKSADTVARLQELYDGEERKTVTEAIKKRLAELVGPGGESPAAAPPQAGDTIPTSTMTTAPDMPGGTPSDPDPEPPHDEETGEVTNEAAVAPPGEVFTPEDRKEPPKGGSGSFNW